MIQIPPKYVFFLFLLLIPFWSYSQNNRDAKLLNNNQILDQITILIDQVNDCLGEKMTTFLDFEFNPDSSTGFLRYSDWKNKVIYFYPDKNTSSDFIVTEISIKEKDIVIERYTQKMKFKKQNGEWYVNFYSQTDSQKFIMKNKTQKYLSKIKNFVTTLLPECAGTQ